MSRSLELLVEDILDCIKKIEKYTEGLSFKNFLKDDKTIDAVVRNFEIIGEASSRIPEEVKKDYPNINWIRIKGFRNVIIHEYFGVDYEILWNIKQEYIPTLKNSIQEIDLDAYPEF
ncbi:MAG: DUF86 domain-containing protein [Bacteroidota bacterium]